MSQDNIPSKDVALRLRELADDLPTKPVHLGLLQQALRGGAAEIEQLRARVTPSETGPVDYVQFGWVPFHEKQGCDPDSFVEHEEDCHEIIEGWRWVPAYAAVRPPQKAGEQQI